MEREREGRERELTSERWRRAPSLSRSCRKSLATSLAVSLVTTTSVTGWPGGQTRNHSRVRNEACTHTCCGESIAPRIKESSSQQLDKQVSQDL